MNYYIGNTRSKLRKVAPIIFWITLGYAPTNIAIGLGLWLSATRRLPYVIVQPPFDARFWGSVFISMGILGGISLYLNRWEIIRAILVFSLFVKALWFYALLLQVGNGGLGVVAIWSFIAFVQLLTVIYFPEG